MFSRVFFSVLRSVAIPIVAFIALKNSFLGESGAFLAITISISIINIVSIVLSIIKILPNALLLRGSRVIGLILSIIVELGSIIGFWLYYLTKYA